MSDTPKPAIQTPFHPTTGGFVGDESSDQIAINSRRDQAEERRGNEEFGRRLEADRFIRECREGREAAAKKAADEEKQRDKEQKKADRARTLFMGSLPGLDSLFAGAACVVNKWPEGQPAEHPAEMALLIAKLEQLLSAIKSRAL